MRLVGNFIITTLAALLGAFLPTALWVAYDGAPAGWIVAMGAGAFLFTFLGTFLLAFIQVLLRQSASKGIVLVVTLLAGAILGALMLSYASPKMAAIGSIYGALTAGILIGLQFSRLGVFLAARPLTKDKGPDAEAPDPSSSA
jgi:hypothetical protein